MNTKDRGDITELKCITKLTEEGFLVSRPITESSRYDVIVDEGDLYRLQIKTGWTDNGCVVFNCKDTRSNRSGNNLKYYTEEDIEAFFVYCDELDEYYWVPISDGTRSTMYIRYEDTKNGYNTSTCNWSEDYRFP